MCISCGASIGANATLLGEITIGQCALIGAGVVVTETVPAYALVVGSFLRDSRMSLEPSWLDRYELEPYLLCQMMRLSGDRGAGHQMLFHRYRQLFQDAPAD